MVPRLVPVAVVVAQLMACTGRPPPEAESAPPAAAASLCDERWTPPPGERSEMADSFRVFSERWLAKLRAHAAAREGPRRLISERFETRLATHQAPHVGVLRYCEQILRCERAGSSCHPMSSNIVTEIFRHQNGEWVY